jgi:tRNA(fMet)-specific endonuclease VapC
MFGQEIRMKRYLLDTNIITAMVKQSPQVWKKVMEVVTARDKIFISSISYYETKRGLLATHATTKMQRFDQIRQDYDMVGIDNEPVLDTASEIYATLKKRGQPLPDADILIAAIARTYGLTLVTDDNHFDRIEGLQVENWVRMS